MLKFYVRHGMEVVKVYTFVSFEQSKWLERYISFNTQKRKKAKNEFEKVFINFQITAFTEKPWKMFVIGLELNLSEKMILIKL